jgi:hypothetical protein
MSHNHFLQPISLKFTQKAPEAQNGPYTECQIFKGTDKKVFKNGRY